LIGTPILQGVARCLIQEKSHIRSANVFETICVQISSKISVKVVKNYTYPESKPMNVDTFGTL